MFPVRLPSQGLSPKARSPERQVQAQLEKENTSLSSHLPGRRLHCGPGSTSAAQVPKSLAPWVLPCLSSSCPEIVQGPQLPSEPDISWTERRLRVQERGNSPQDRILLSWEAEAENQLHWALGLPSCSFLWEAGQPARQPFPPVAQALPSLGHVQECGVEWTLAFLR